MLKAGDVLSIGQANITLQAARAFEAEIRDAQIRHFTPICEWRDDSEHLIGVGLGLADGRSLNIIAPGGEGSIELRPRPPPNPQFDRQLDEVIEAIRLKERAREGEPIP